MYFKTIAESNRGIDCEEFNEETIEKLNKIAEKNGVIIDYENDIIIHPVLGAFVCNFPVKKNSEPQEELLNTFNELIKNGCHLVLGKSFNATISNNCGMDLYGVYCTNYQDFIQIDKSKERTK